MRRAALMTLWRVICERFPTGPEREAWRRRFGAAQRSGVPVAVQAAGPLFVTHQHHKIFPGATWEAPTLWRLASHRGCENLTIGAVAWECQRSDVSGGGARSTSPRPDPAGARWSCRTNWYRRSSAGGCAAQRANTNWCSPTEGDRSSSSDLLRTGCTLRCGGRECGRCGFTI